MEVELLWVAGHVDILSNELADKTAKHAALEAACWRQDEDQSIKTLQKVKLQIRKCVMADWQRGWDSQNEGHFTNNLYPTVSTKPMSTHFSRDVDIKLNRLQSGYTLLPSHAHKLGITNTDLCSCGNDVGTINHGVLHCSNQSWAPLIFSINPALIDH